MYLPAHFAETRLEVLHALVRHEPFGQLVTRQGDHDISADGIPFMLDANLGMDNNASIATAADASLDGAMAVTTVGAIHAARAPAGAGSAFGVLRAHVARANPLWQNARTDVESLVIFQGAQAYISPGWYASKAEHGKVVPTWNYIVVQARGVLRVIDDAEWVRRLVTRLTHRHEAAMASPWSVADAPAAFTETMLAQIVGIEIELTSLVGKWKVSQNRSAADRAGVVRGLGQVHAADTAMARAIEASGRKV